MKKRLLILVGVLVVLWCTGCAAIGPTTVTRDRFDYTTAISESWKSQMLVNMVKVRYGDAPIFLDVASVINQYAVEGLVDLRATWASPKGGGPGLGNFLGVGGTGRYTDRPTITYSPLTGEKFARSLMTPIPPPGILNIIQAGYRVDLVFRLCVQSINGIKNRYAGSARAHPADPEFFPLIERMRRIQESGAIGMRVQKGNERDAVMFVFSGKVDEKIQADITEVRKILGLDPKAKEVKVVYGSVAANDQEIAILSRSMIQVLIDLASYIEVPETHLAEKRVNPSLKDDPVGGVPVPSLMRIYSSPKRPDDAFVSIPYRDHWFWIDDKDLPSKQLFSFLMFIFTLTETGGKEGAPIVTIPAG